MDEPRNNGPTTRGKPFAPGNRGRPKGARHKSTLAAEALLDGEAKALTQVAVSAALAGDPIALRLCLERIVPPRKDRPLRFDLPTVSGAADHPAAISAVLGAVARGELTPSEAEAFSRLLAAHRQALELVEIEARLAALEATRDG